MVYTSNDWTPGDLITAAKMNNLEEQYTESLSYINASTGITPISVSASSNISGENISAPIELLSSTVYNDKLIMYRGIAGPIRQGFKKTYTHPVRFTMAKFEVNRTTLDTGNLGTGPIYCRVRSVASDTILYTSPTVNYSSNITKSTVGEVISYSLPFSVPTSDLGVRVQVELGTTTEGHYDSTSGIYVHYTAVMSISSQSRCTYASTVGYTDSTATQTIGSLTYGVTVLTE